MAQTWATVESSPKFQALSPDQQQEAKQQYFDTVVRQNPKFQSLGQSEQASAAGQFFGNSSIKPDSLNRFANADNRIAARPSGIQDLVRNPPTMQHPLGAALRTLGAAGQLYQGVPASIALDLQRGRPQDIMGNLGKTVTGQRVPQYGDVFKGANNNEQSLRGALGRGMAKAAPVVGLATDIALSPGGAESMAAVGKGAINLGKGTIENIKNIPDNFFRGGLTKPEAIRIEQQYGGSNGSLVETVKGKLNEQINKAQDSYKKAINGFKGNAINSQEFYQTIQKGLRDKGWVDLQGNPTARFQSGLDPVVDKLTNLYLDLRNAPTSAGKRITGQIMSKEDFSTYRDALGAMLREKPSDVLVMGARNALYNSAEKSGMSGIKVARDMEKTAFQRADQFLNRNTGDLKIATEARLSRIGTDKPLSQQEIRHIQELQRYVNHPIISEADKINKLNKAKDIIRNMKQYGKGAAGAAVAGEVGRKAFTGRF